MVNATRGLLWLAGAQVSIPRKKTGRNNLVQGASVDFGNMRIPGHNPHRQNLTHKRPSDIQRFKIAEVMLQQSARWDPSPLSLRSVHEAV